MIKNENSVLCISNVLILTQLKDSTLSNQFKLFSSSDSNNERFVDLCNATKVTSGKLRLIFAAKLSYDLI